MSALCGACGTVHPKGARTCTACGASAGRSVEGPDTAGEQMLLGVWCTFQCRSCGFASPIDSLDGTGGVFCLKCGLHQRFPLQSWVDGLRWAHGVVDLAGPIPEGHHPHPTWSIHGADQWADLGVARATDTYAESGHHQDAQGVVPRTLRIVAGPGHPLCDACQAPVRVEVQARGLLHAVCACGGTASYQTPADALALADGLVGVIGPEHRVDNPEAGRGAERGFTCGSCGGPLPVDGSARLVACEFCRKVSRIPLQALQGLAAPPPPDHWWWVFRGPSEQRAVLLRDVTGATEDKAVEDPPPKAKLDAGGYFRIGFRQGAATVALIVGVALYLVLWFLLWGPPLLSRTW